MCKILFAYNNYRHYHSKYYHILVWSHSMRCRQGSLATLAQLSKWRRKSLGLSVAYVCVHITLPIRHILYMQFVFKISLFDEMYFHPLLIYTANSPNIQQAAHQNATMSESITQISNALYL